MAALTARGHQALFVGGCVRNALLAAPVSDLDISISARPEVTTELAEAAGLKAVPTGFEHGTVTVVADGQGFEVTTFRRDVETDGRHAQVVFSERVEEDAARRDFTMNALYADRTGQVIDPLGGLPDLQARRLRFIGDAGQRIAEDYLRILRFFRFHAWYADPELGIDADGLAACAAGAEGLDCLAAERVGQEMRKLLAAPDPAPSLAAMDHSGVLARILPGADSKSVAPLVAFETDNNQSPDPIRRLAALGGEDAAQRFRLSKIEQRHLSQLQDALRQDKSLGEMAQDFGAERAWDLALTRAAMIGQPVAPDTETRIARAASAKFPVKAADLKGYSGKAIGTRLRQLRSAWIASDFTLDKSALLALPSSDGSG